MTNNIFHFKQFKIKQDGAAMKVGTDGVLLGAWADCSQANSILDIGIGTGLIALMMAQRSNALITGIEIDETAYNEACYNRDKSPWPERIQFHLKSLQELAKSDDAKYDLIVSNPPFFVNSLKSDDEARTQARHTDTLSTNDLLKYTKHLLKPSGKCCFIIPSSNLDTYREVSTQYGLYINKLLWIKTTPKKEPIGVLIELSTTKKDLIQDTMIREEFGRHKYSEAYINLTKDFYLNM